MKKTTTKAVGPPEPPKIDLSDGHHMGKYTGYEVWAGKVYPAPSHTRRFGEIKDQRLALEDYVKTLNAFIESRFQELQKAESAWWDHVSEDLGFDKYDGRWVYNGQDRCLRRLEEPKPDAAPKGGPAG